MGRLECGRWIVVFSVPGARRTWFEVLLPVSGCACGCCIVTIAGFYLTWLGDECYGAVLERHGKALKRLASIRRIRAEATRGEA